MTAKAFLLFSPYWQLCTYIAHKTLSEMDEAFWDLVMGRNLKSVFMMHKGAVSHMPGGIRVNALCPGMIATAFHDTFTPVAVREKVAGMTSLRREAPPRRSHDFGGLFSILGNLFCNRSQY